MSVKCGFCQMNPATVKVEPPEEWHESVNACKPCAVVAKQFWALALDESGEDVIDAQTPVAAAQPNEAATDAVETTKKRANVRRNSGRTKRSAQGQEQGGARPGDTASVAGG